MADTPKPKAKPAKPGKAAYSGPALTEENLPAYDKAELASERALRAKVEECKVAAKAAKGEIEKLTAEKKALDPKAADFKAKSKEIGDKIKGLQGVAKKTCKLSHPGCVASDKSTRVPMPSSITDNINKDAGTNIDFDKLSAWEGGAYTQGYIPWWPHMKGDTPTIQAMSDSSGTVGPRIKGDLGGEAKNKSGATVGVGVDLGQSSAAGFGRVLDKSNKKADGLTEDELKALKAKIEPYFNKQGGEACKYLQDHPLNLTEKEINFLNKAAHEDALDTAKSSYANWVKENKEVNAKKFTELTREQQTALLSNGYQYGSPKKALIEAIVTGDRDKIPAKIRERDYLFNAMPAVEKKPAAPATPAAPAAEKKP
ncbi:hypothetical protein HF313_01925 [Massilia atriviolacea]|uniref:Pesticin C-terminal domain-containing protein n=1 Tax=Massilia atriviolacea TaxID=2495579 RepID=A0A430HNS5_9BURK|nr:pesticin C-terminus-like muramidase [Massilia atriviolacea]RSZ59186.1 hypothetical protein EJB06_08320 [Massilia atriviolacea]